MDKLKSYRIVNAYEIVDSIETSIPSKSAEHRIGRVGNIVKAVLGEGLRFAYQDGGMLHTSKIQEVRREIRKNKECIQVNTLNTVYLFERVKGEE